MKNLLYFFLMLSTLLIFSIVQMSAQTDSVYWRSTATAGYYVPSTTVGRVIGDNMMFANDAVSPYGTASPGAFLYGNGSYTNSIPLDPDSGTANNGKYTRIDFQNIYPGQTAPGYPRYTVDTLNNVWVQYKIRPITGYKLHVNKLYFDITGSGSSTMRARAFISTDPYFRYKTQILDTSYTRMITARTSPNFGQDTTAPNLASYSFTHVKVTGIDTLVQNGQSFMIRVYPWIHNDTGLVTGKRVIIRNVGIVGTTESATSVGSESVSIIPEKFSVEQNYPNPFNPVTNIKFGLPTASNVTVKVFNLLGQEISTVFSGYKTAGNYSIPFNAAHLPSGIYLYKIEAGNFVDVKKMTLIK